MRTRTPGRRSRKRRTTTPPKVVGMAIGKVIAVRHLQSATGPRVTATVQIGAPRKTRGQDDYHCPYRIVGLGDAKVRAAYGVDAVQALQLVMRAIGSALWKLRDLRWFDGEDLGFPHPDEMLAAPERTTSGGEEPRLPEMLARAEAASPGPWKAFVEGRDHESGSSFIRVGDGAARRDDIELSGATPADYDFIAHARQDVPALVEEVRRLRTLLRER